MGPGKKPDLLTAGMGPSHLGAKTVRRNKGLNRDGFKIAKSSWHELRRGKAGNANLLIGVPRKQAIP